MTDATDRNGKARFDTAADLTTPDLYVTDRFTRTGENTIRYAVSLEDPTIDLS